MPAAVSKLGGLLDAVGLASALQSCADDELKPHLLRLLTDRARAVQAAPAEDDLIDPELEPWEPCLLSWLTGGGAVSGELSELTGLAFPDAAMRCGVERMRSEKRAMHLTSKLSDELVEVRDLLDEEVDVWERLLLRIRGCDGWEAASDRAISHATSFLTKVAAVCTVSLLAEHLPPALRPRVRIQTADLAAVVRERRVSGPSGEDPLVTAAPTPVSESPHNAEFLQWGGDRSPSAPTSPKRALRRALESHQQKRQQMCDLRQRLASFRDFPCTSKVCNPRTLSDAGFFHAPLPGHPDGTSCYSCGVWLCGWEPEDVPAAVHAEMDRLQCNNCAFLASQGSDVDDAGPITIRSPSAAAPRKKLVSACGCPSRQLLLDSAKMEELFRTFDRDGSGKIDKEEFKKVWAEWESFGVGSDDREIDRVFSQFDTHGDDGVLSFREFSMLMLQRLKM